MSEAEKSIGNNTVDSKVSTDLYTDQALQIDFSTTLEMTEWSSRPLVSRKIDPV